jgi:hypothetical protein
MLLIELYAVFLLNLNNKPLLLTDINLLIDKV